VLVSDASRSAATPIVGHPEVGEEDPLGLVVVVGPAGQQDVGGLDISVQEVTAVRVVKGGGHLADDAHGALRRHTGVVVRQRLFGVGAVDVPHADPQLAVLRTAIVHRHDVRVVQLGDGVGLPFETPDESRVVAQFRPQ